LPALKELAQRFHDRLRGLKQATPLPPGAAWYPWASLGQFDVLDEFLKGDPGALLALIGSDPVLDAGCGDGDVAFFLESLGARVDAVDFAPTNYNALFGIRALKDRLASSVEVHAVDLDARPHLPRAQYGLTVMLGVLYHLKNPFLALEAIARHSRHIFLSTRIAALSPDGRTRLGGLPLAYLVDEQELNADDTNFWIFTQAGFERVVTRAGWDVICSAVRGPAESADPVSPAGDARGFLLARSRLVAPPCPFRLLYGWHEIEQGSWRWTERRFGAALDVAEPRQVAALRLVFRLPEVSFADHPAIHLRARVNGRDLPALAYTAPGEHEYLAPLGTLPAGEVRVEFELDHAVAPSLRDQRELGVLVDFSGEPALTV
jgi:tRNA (mo5U34)-methyltransferase